MDKEFLSAIRQISDEKGLTEDMVLSTIESALAAAYRKDYGDQGQKIEAEFDKKTGETKFYRIFEIVEEIENPEAEVLINNTKVKSKKAKVGDEIKEKLKAPKEYGRIAAQTAKQVIIQKIRELERDVIFEEFKDKEGSLLTGVVQQIEGPNVIINLGKANGVIFPSEQMHNEKYYIGQRLKVYLATVDKTNRGPLILVSRAHPELIRKLFELEVPEINSGSIEVKAISREAGKRTKLAVIATQDGVDPIGSCVGQRGTRVQSVLAEVGEEKIDIVLWNKEPKAFIENSLSPAKVKKVIISKKNGVAKVVVDEDQLSLAIGREGQNVRLASKLTGYEIDIEKAKDKKKESGAKNQEETSEKKETEKTDEDKKLKDKIKENKPETKKPAKKTKKGSKDTKVEEKPKKPAKKSKKDTDAKTTDKKTNINIKSEKVKKEPEE